MKSKEEIYNDIVSIIEEHYNEAYPLFKKEVSNICSRVASEKEVENLMDSLLGETINDDFLELFRMVCEHYYRYYPECIEFYIYERIRLFEEDDDDDNDEPIESYN